MALDAQLNVKSVELVKDIITNKLYPTDTPEFDVDVLGFMEEDHIWSVLLMSTLPDDMMYWVHWSVDQTNSSVMIYKKIEI